MLMIGAINVDYLGKGVGPTPFSTDNPPPVVHPLTGMVSEPPLPPFTVEWEWMVTPLMGTQNAPALAFGPPPVMAPAMMAHMGVADRGLRRCQRSPPSHKRSPPRSSSPW